MEAKYMKKDERGKKKEKRKEKVIRGSKRAKYMKNREELR
jgi:hypothetical protein